MYTRDEFLAAAWMVRKVLESNAEKPHDDAGTTAFLDQVDAAHEDALQVSETLAETLLEEDPTHWHFDSGEGSFESRTTVMAYLTAAAGFFEACEHLTSPQPTYVIGALHKVLCSACLGKLGKVELPEGEGDRCDLCGKRGLKEFWDVTMTMTAITFIGDVCDECMNVLRSMNEEGS